MEGLINFLPFLAIAAIIILVIVIKKKIKNKRSSCPQCKKMYSYPDDFEIVSGELKWRKETKQETKGDITYDIEYLVYYRIVTFYFKCSKCGYSQAFNRSYDLYSSDAKYSQNTQEEINVLKLLIRNSFNKEVFGDKDISIANIDY